MAISLIQNLKFKIHKRLLVAEAREQSHIDIFGESRFAPMLDCQAADQTKPPVPLLAERLEFQGQGCQFIHGSWRSFMNQRCCSTSPEKGTAGRWVTAHVALPEKILMDCAVSAARMSASRTCCSSGAARSQRATCARSASISVVVMGENIGIVDWIAKEQFGVEEKPLHGNAPHHFPVGSGCSE